MVTKYFHFGSRWISVGLVIILVILLPKLIGQDTTFQAYAQEDNPSPPQKPVKLIFIHHSTGENWLADNYGNLGLELEANNYFVSDTNYGWGPNSIGDRTDIINWQEWFRSPDTPTIMEAVYNESDQWDWDGWYYYTRNMPDPGGENEIIIFKSCFPNSELNGNPNDPPTPGGDFTVGNAKYIYNDLLNYFRTRPDKLFIIITAPPVQDNSHAENARAFNQWLINEWLVGYDGNNVAVWDFYNVLTGPDHHHRFINGQVEHVHETGANTLFYPSDDDHPSVVGSQKASEEFIPMLNVFYNRWKADASTTPQVQVETTPTSRDLSAAEATETSIGATKPPAAITEFAPGGGVDVIDDFEGRLNAGTEYWESFRDESVPTTINCELDNTQAYDGDHSLRLDFNVKSNSWATCELSLRPPQNWINGDGLGLYIHANQPTVVFDVLIFGGSQDVRESYTYTIETIPETMSGWTYIEIPWSQLHRVDWEENAGSPFSTPENVVGIAFGFNADEGAENIGTIWIDDLALISTTVTPTPESLPVEETRNSPSLCPGSVSLILLVAMGFVYVEMRKVLKQR